jgi:hypothetical protein
VVDLLVNLLLTALAQSDLHFISGRRLQQPCGGTASRLWETHPYPLSLPPVSRHHCGYQQCEDALLHCTPSLGGFDALHSVGMAKVCPSHLIKLGEDSRLVSAFLMGSFCYAAFTSPSQPTEFMQIAGSLACFAHHLFPHCGATRHSQALAIAPPCVAHRVPVSQNGGCLVDKGLSPQVCPAS